MVFGIVEMLQEEKVRLWPRTVSQARSMAASHLARYQFARSAVQGGRVCDIACGAGYGSCFLSKYAGSVVGMDISDSAIEWAREHFQNDKVSFYCADGSKNWPVNETFDVITSFETLEHVPHPEEFLEQLVSHLKPTGVLFLSVPNGPRDKKKTDNPYHLHHFTENDLKELIRKHFTEPRFYSQAYKKNFKHYGAKWFRKLHLVKKQMYFPENYYLSKGLDTELKTWFVIAKKKGIEQSC